MLIDENINPERDLYYLGGVLIDILNRRDQKEVDYLIFYQWVNHEVEITFNLYSLTLDWLFILGLIEKGKNGRIRICF